jgi:hypothetical protein
MTPRLHKPTDPIIQWAFLFEAVHPRQTSTCAIFWRSIILTPIKLIGPVAGGAAVLWLLLAGLAPFALPAAIRPAPLPAHQPDEMDVFFGYLLIAMLIALAVGAVGHAIGLWKYLHGFCSPVEIEGGLVVKATCPEPKCFGRLVLADDGAWRCRKCHGFFVPAAPAGHALRTQP